MEIGMEYFLKIMLPGISTANEHHQPGEREQQCKCRSVLITFKCKSKGTGLRQVIFNNTSSWAIKIFICHHLIDWCSFQLFVYFMLVTFLGQWEQVASNLHLFF